MKKYGNKPEKNGDDLPQDEEQGCPSTNGGSFLDSGVVEALQTIKGRNKLRRVLGLPPETEEFE